jgi:hypothetical protein
MQGRLAAMAVMVGALTGLALPAYAQSAENVAVVINENSQASEQIGDYYAKKGGLPAATVVRI